MENEFIYFPMFINLIDKKVVVIGGGNIAFRRISTLLKTGAEITVVAPWICDDLKNIKSDKLKIIKKMYEKDDIKDAFMVLAITDDKNVNTEIFADCKMLGITVNVADDKEKCDFFFPGIIAKDGCSIGVCGNGKDHKLVKDIAKKIRNVFR